MFIVRSGAWVQRRKRRREKGGSWWRGWYKGAHVGGNAGKREREVGTEGETEKTSPHALNSFRTFWASESRDEWFDRWNFLAPAATCWISLVAALSLQLSNYSPYTYTVVPARERFDSVFSRRLPKFEGKKKKNTPDIAVKSNRILQTSDWYAKLS